MIEISSWDECPSILGGSSSMTESYSLSMITGLAWANYRFLCFLVRAREGSFFSTGNVFLGTEFIFRKLIIKLLFFITTNILKCWLEFGEENKLFQIKNHINKVPSWPSVRMFDNFLIEITYLNFFHFYRVSIFWVANISNFYQTSFRYL